MKLQGVMSRRLYNSTARVQLKQMKRTRVGDLVEVCLVERLAALLERLRRDESSGALRVLHVLRLPPVRVLLVHDLQYYEYIRDPEFRVLESVGSTLKHTLHVPVHCVHCTVYITWEASRSAPGGCRPPGT